MAAKKSSGKLIAILVVALIGGIAGYGYVNQATTLQEKEAVAEANAASQPDGALLAVKPTDITLGDPNALVTVVEYVSLSCTHCADFHSKVISKITESFITTGKAKVIVRHFPLNAPALAGAKLVECAGNNGLDRSNFVKVLFDMQTKWAFDENYLKNLKPIALVGGVDSAAFDSCMADKDLETRLISDRQEAADKLKINSTPTIFVNGTEYTGERAADAFGAALTDAFKARASANAKSQEATEKQ